MFINIFNKFKDQILNDFIIEEKIMGWACLANHPIYHGVSTLYNNIQ